MIEAAGGLVWRATGADHIDARMIETAIEVLLIHRPARDDWSLPKGKLRRRESAQRCALREVHEETGLRCSIGEELPTARYRDRKGRTKQVRYWSMQRRSGSFRPNREVDEVRWIAVGELADWLTDHELDVVDGFVSLRVAVA